MKRLIFLLSLLLLPAQGERLAINSKRAPEGREDLLKIQQLVQNSLPKTRAATVCLRLEEGFGSGVIVSKEGLIMTAAHVAGQPGSKIDVIFEDGREVAGHALGLNSETDEALIKITEEGEYPYVEVDRKGSVQLGDWVFALGYPGGFDLERGIVIRLGRIVRMANNTMQSDCDLIGGDSGGPLFDLSGRLVGIHSRVGGRLPENMHVPTTSFEKNWERLLEGEFMGDGPFARRLQAEQEILGIDAIPWQREEKEEAGASQGVIIIAIINDSAAENAGLLAGDIIVKLEGNPITSVEELRTNLSKINTQEEISVEILREMRDGLQSQRITIHFAKKVENDSEDSPQQQKEEEKEANHDS